MDGELCLRSGAGQSSAPDPGLIASVRIVCKQHATIVGVMFPGQQRLEDPPPLPCAFCLVTLWTAVKKAAPRGVDLKREKAAVRMIGQCLLWLHNEFHFQEGYFAQIHFYFF